MILRVPFIGLLAWLWIALMNPNREVYGFLQGAPLNFYLAVFTALAWLFSLERKMAPPNAFTILLLVFAGWASVSTFFALDRSHALPIWDRTMKTVVLVLAVLVLAYTRVRLQAVIWTIAISLGYFGVKGGGVTLLGGAQSHVFGPPDSMIEDNNALGLALVMLLPLLNYLRLTSARWLVRLALLLAIALTFVAILGTYSRGALIALVVSAAIYVVRSRSGVVLLLAAALAVWLLPALLPADWFERMATIQSAGDDTSFQERLAAWTTSLNIARAHPLIGGGFIAVEQDWIAQVYGSSGGLPVGRAAHSIYFQVLGDTGFAGLAIYLSAVAAAILNTFLVLRAVQGRVNLTWAAQLARMLQVSIGAFLVGGAALSMAYYDGVLVLLALTAALLRVAKQPDGREFGAVAPAWKMAPPGSALLRAIQK